MIKSLKRFVYGWCPYVFTKTYAPASPKLEYYKFFKEHPYTHHPYDFAAQYLDMDVVVSRDTVKGLPYVLHVGRRLYFPAAFSDRQVSVAYKCLMLEQDVRQPHHYVDSMEELRGMTLCDVGASEGFTSLEAIDYVRHIYLFEYDPAWIEALEATFEPWRDKVTLVKKFVGDADDDKNVRLDTFFKDKSTEGLFIKMDIEGVECMALSGAVRLFRNAEGLEFAVCTYHRKNDLSDISAFLDSCDCRYFPRDKYIYIDHRLRVAILRGRNAVARTADEHA